MSADQYYSGVGYEEDEAQVYEGAAYTAEPVRVSEVSQRAAPEYGACMTWAVPQVGVGLPVQILTRRLRRHKARISLQLPTAESSISASGTVTSPTAGQTIASAVLPAGIYTVSWTVQLGGTTGNPEQNNFQLVVGATVIETSINGTGSGTTTPQLAVEITVPAGGATVAIQAIILGTVASVYRAQFTAVPVNPLPGGASSIIFNYLIDRLQGTNPQGFTITTAPWVFEWESQQPLYAIAIGAASSVSVIDESYVER